MNPKLLLFDIDGTLLSAHGVPKIAMATVLERRYQCFEYDTNYDFSGRTDPQIVEHLLKYDNREYSEDLTDEILGEFCIELNKEIVNGKKPVIHPGVCDLVEKLSITENVYLGLVTGNVSEGARIKLEAVDLQTYFPIGGFGDDSKDRNELPPIAKLRAEKYFSTKFLSNDIWIIGDSIYDVECAQKNGLRCLAVATGKTSKDKLIEANPEFIEEDFSDLDKIQHVLING
jgi:phosphoglycolate phosphatase-like HAD superfamily hydrolase